MPSTDLRLGVSDLYARYAECLGDGAIDDWPDFFVENCLYRIVPRSNFERNMLIGPIYAENKGALLDRVAAIKSTMVYAPRYLTYQITSPRITELSNGQATSRATFSVYQTMTDGNTTLFLTGRSFDEVRIDGPSLLFSRRVVVLDTDLLASAVVFPL